jgi:hypothetical protein
LGVIYLPVGQKLFDTAAIPAIAWPFLIVVMLVSFTVVNALNRLSAR